MRRIYTDLEFNSYPCLSVKIRGIRVLFFQLHMLLMNYGIYKTPAFRG
jgi:hypothetical protein